ncbi:MAG TPA: nucleoside-diphosphate sugar epimerase/dehydratase [Streptosporangiaceae bacterium]|nr:nucleoside-diphosphate sugar epimerase/dehydratase [Streptosporangiaceae bacterium]
MTRLPKMGAEVVFDAAAWLTGLACAARVTRDLPATTVNAADLARVAGAVFVLVPACGALAGLYRSRFHRGSLDEVSGVVMASMAITLCLAVTLPVLVSGQRQPSGVVVLPAAVLAGSVMLGGRYMVFAARLRARRAAETATKIIVFGAGDAGEQLIRRLVTQPGAAYRPVAVLDDDPAKRQLRIHGVPVLGDRTAMAEVAARTGARVLVIALAGATGPVIRAVTAAAEECGLTPKVIPSVRELLTGGARIEGVRDPRISDLLGRCPVQTDGAAVRAYIRGKRVLVTGAGGSVGSELCRQLHRLGPAELVMLDQDESALHAVQLQIHGRAMLDSDETVLADIRDHRRVHEVFARFRPQVVFHAAALKHLPLLERYPAEALKSNVWGTQTVLAAAAACSTESFVNISTDKAADPVSVLGYSKRIAERLTAHMATQAHGSYLSVRFGNVLGSRGSVLTTLSAQVALGGPVTVTHPEVDRYFMTADEAVQLVLQAAVIGRDGEVLVLDMGAPVRIADIARRLAASTDRPVDLVFTGLRPGEKLQETLLGRGEADRRPSHPLISQTPAPPLDPELTRDLDPSTAPQSLRAALAACAQAPALCHPCPAQVSRAGHELVQEFGRLGIGLERAAGRVGHVVGGTVAEHAGAVPALVDPGQPRRQ